MQESGVVNIEKPEESKVSMVYGQMNEPPENGLRVALTGLTILNLGMRGKCIDVCGQYLSIYFGWY